MFSPLDNKELDHWFRRLDAAWKRMPAEERTRQREEVQQHLEALVAAKAAEGQSSEDAWENALRQFGDPVQIGHKIYREWCQSRTGFRADLTAISFILGLLICKGYVVLGLSASVPSGLRSHEILISVTTLLAYAIAGFFFPFQAIKSALYGFCVVVAQFWICLGVLVYIHHINQPQPLSTMFIQSLSTPPIWPFAIIITAYLASVTKRGWYRPTLDDFKLTLPTRRWEVG